MHRSRWYEVRHAGKLTFRDIELPFRGTEVIAEVERRVRRALASPQLKPDTGRRIAELQRQVGNLAEAIVLDGLKGSVALAQRFAAAEAELERLRSEARASEQLSTSVSHFLPRIGERYLAIAERLAEHLGVTPSTRGRR